MKTLAAKTYPAEMFCPQNMIKAVNVEESINLSDIDSILFFFKLKTFLDVKKM